MSIASRLLSTKLGQIAKQPMRDALDRLGYGIVSVTEHPDSRLRRYFTQYDIHTLLDVGANQGQYARQMRRLGFRGQMLSFEPGTEAYRLLSRNSATDYNWETVCLAIGAEPGTAQLQLSHNSVSSSLLQISQRHVDAAPMSRIDRSETVNLSRLDDVTRDAAPPFWLKIDTQGYELEVLKGAKATLPQCAVVQVELSFTTLYIHQPPFVDVLQHLLDSGLVIADLIPGFRDTNMRLLQADALLVREQR